MASLRAVHMHAILMRGPRGTSGAHEMQTIHTSACAPTQTFVSEGGGQKGLTSKLTGAQEVSARCARKHLCVRVEEHVRRASTRALYMGRTVWSRGEQDAPRPT